MTWDYRKFPSQPVAAKKFEMRGRNTIVLYYHYRIDPELGKGVSMIRNIPCACPAYAVKLDKD